MNNLERLINWLKEIQQGKDPLVPYNLHCLVRLFHDNMGTTEAIERLEELNRMKEEK